LSERHPQNLLKELLFWRSGISSHC